MNGNKLLNEKTIVIAGNVIVGYYALSTAITQLPQFALLTKPLYAGINAVVIAGAITLYGAYVLFNKY